MTKIPQNDLCAVKGCGHRYADHDYGNINECAVCTINAKGGFPVPPLHTFVRRVTGQEREAYEKAMRES